MTNTMTSRMDLFKVLEEEQVGRQFMEKKELYWRLKEELDGKMLKALEKVAPTFEVDLV